MALRPVCECDVTLREAPVPSVALIEWCLVSGTRTIGMMPWVAEVSVETFVGDVNVANEREGLKDGGGYRDSCEYQLTVVAWE